MATSTKRKKKMIKVLGINDAVNSCDCCGKSNLKSTVIVSIDGVVFHYGSTCAARNLNISKLVLNAGIRLAKEQAEREFEIRRGIAMVDVMNLPSFKILQDQTTATMKTGLIGKPFKEAMQPYRDAFAADLPAIATKHGLKISDFW